jgi:hypothetical protein
MLVRDVLLQARLITPDMLTQAEAHAAQVHRPLVHVLASYNVVDARQMARAIERASQSMRSGPIGFIDVSGIDVHPRLLQLVPRAAAEQWRILPIAKARGEERLYLAMSDPFDDDAVAAVERATALRVQPMVCDDTVLTHVLDKHYGAEAPVLVGAMLDAVIDDDFLTESTAEAIEFVRSSHEGHRATSVALDELTVEVSRIARPASVALGDLSLGARPTLGFVAEANLPRGAQEHLPAGALSPLTTQLTPMPVFSTGEVTPVDHATSTKTRVVLAARRDDTVFQAALKQMLGDVVDVVLDDVAACRLAHTAEVLVLVEPAAKSTLLRALLDLEDTPGRAKVLVLGGGATFGELTVVDEFGASASEPHALAVAVVAGLRRLGFST